MSDAIISFIPENDQEFKALLSKAGEKISDFRIPFNLIAGDWYRGNRKLFTLKSEGLYPPLGGLKPQEKVMYRGQLTTKRERAEVEKSEKFGFIYPLLKATGALEKSITSKSAPGAEFFIGRQTLVMGTRIPYAKYHQSDRPRTKLPQRKMIFIDGGPAEQAKDAQISGRLERWTNIVNDYVKQVLTGRADI